MRDLSPDQIHRLGSRRTRLGFLFYIRLLGIASGNRKVGRALVSLFRRRNFQKAVTWMEWTEKDEKHQMFISLQLSDSGIGGAP
jgi:hypothetical protein